MKTAFARQETGISKLKLNTLPARQETGIGKRRNNQETHLLNSNVLKRQAHSSFENSICLAK